MTVSFGEATRRRDDGMIGRRVGMGRNLSCIQMICCSWRTGRMDRHWDRNFGYGVW